MGSRTCYSRSLDACVDYGAVSQRLLSTSVSHAVVLCCMRLQMDRKNVLVAIGVSERGAAKKLDGKDKTKMLRSRLHRCTTRLALYQGLLLHKERVPATRKVSLMRYGESTTDTAPLAVMRSQNPTHPSTTPQSQCHPALYHTISSPSSDRTWLFVFVRFLAIQTSSSLY